MGDFRNIGNSRLEVTTRDLKMFLLSPEDWENLKCQFGTSSCDILPLLQPSPDTPKRDIGFRVEEGKGAPYRAGSKQRKKKHS